AADADLQIGFDVAATLGADTHQLADALSVQYLEGIIGKNFPIDIAGEKAARVIAAQTKSRLGQIVCAERKEVCVLRNLVGRQSRPRQFDHRADRVFDLKTMFSHDLASDVVDNVALLLQHFTYRNQRHH